MFKHRWMVAAAAAGVVGLCLMFAAWTNRTTAAPAPAEGEQGSFRGKVLLVRSNFGVETVVLEQVRVRQFGSQSFLLGKMVETNAVGRDSMKGKTVWLNMSQITQMVECEDAGAAKKMLEALPPQAGGYAIAPTPTTAGTPVAGAPEALPVAPRAKP